MTISNKMMFYWWRPPVLQLKWCRWWSSSGNLKPSCQSINVHCLYSICIMYCACGRAHYCPYNPLTFPTRIQLACSRYRQPHRITYSKTSSYSVLIKVLLLSAACLSIVCFNKSHQLWKLSLKLILVRGDIMGYSCKPIWHFLPWNVKLALCICWNKISRCFICSCMLLEWMRISSK